MRCKTNYHACSKDFLNSANQISWLGAEPHGFGNADDFIEGDVSIVLD